MNRPRWYPAPDPAFPEAGCWAVWIGGDLYLGRALPRLFWNIAQGHRPFVRWSPPGEISKAGCWTCSWGAYLYIADSLLALLCVVVLEYKHDKHLAG